MKKIWNRIFAVAGREFFASLASSSAWVFLVLFLVLSGLCTFVVSDILSSEQADLRSFFHWMPWLFLLLLPALSMPFWSEERRIGTMDLTLSYPVSIWELVAGKYLAGMGMLIFALFLTLPTPITIYLLGSPDAGAILCGYLGTIMLGSAFLSVSCFCSALTKSQTASFLLSLFFCGFLVLSGWEKIAGMMREHLPVWMDLAIAELSIIPHFQAFQRGLLDTTEFVYCIGITVLFLCCTGFALAFSSSGIGSLFSASVWKDKYTWHKTGQTLLGILLAFYGFFCAVTASGVFSLRLDCTADHAFSLTPLSKSLALGVSQPVSLRLYMSPTDSNMPNYCRQYGERVQWLLQELASASDGMIRLQIIRPEPDSPEEECARMDGITPVRNQTGDSFYLGLALSSYNREAVIPYLFPQRENKLEYEVMRKIQNITSEKKKTIGVMSPFPLLGRRAEPQHGITGFPPWYIFTSQSDDYAFAHVPVGITKIPDEVDVLMVIQPSGLPPQAESVIEDYILRGGKVMIFLDPRFSFAEVSARRDYSMMEKVSSDLPALLPAWGIQWNKEELAADLDFKYDHISSTGLRQTIPTSLRITADGISRQEPMTQRLTSIWMNYAGFLKVTASVEGLSYEPVIFSSHHAKSVPASERPERIFAGFKKEETDSYPLALKIRGKFPATMVDLAPQAVKESEVWIFGDCDMLFHDACVGSIQDQFGQQLLVPCSDNLTLIRNVMESLSGNVSLAELRSRVHMNRPLKAVKEKREKAELAFRDRLLNTMKGYEQDSRKVSILQNAILANPGKFKLTPDQRKLLDDFARREADLKREIKMHRNQLKQDLDEISYQARLWNIVIVPALTALLGILWGILRKRMGRY